MFAASRFRMADGLVRDQAPARVVVEYLAVLHLAAREGEDAVDEALRWLLDQEQRLGATAVAEVVRQGRRLPPVTDVTVAAGDLGLCDRLWLGGEADGGEPGGNGIPIDRV